MYQINSSIISLIVPFLFISCGRSSGEDSHGHNHDHDHDQHIENEHKHQEHDNGVIELSPEDAAFLGVKTNVIDLSDFGDVLHVSGVLESMPTDSYTVVSKSSGLVSFAPNLSLGSNVKAGSILGRVSSQGIAGGDQNEISYEEMEIAKRELDRIKPLHEEGIVSTRDYNEVEANYRRAVKAYSGAKSGSEITSKIDGVVTAVLVDDGSYVDSGSPIVVVTKGDRLMLRADVPARCINQISNKLRGNIRFNGIDKIYSMDSLNVRQQSKIVSQMSGGYIPVYFTIDNNREDVVLVPGMLVELFLQNSGLSRSLVVPFAAVSEQQGVYFVYEKLDDDCYKKVPVKLGPNDGVNVQIISGITPGVEIVTEGTVFVKLAESNGAVPEGHTHSH